MLWLLASLMLTPAEDTHATTFLSEENATSPIIDQTSLISPDTIQISALLYASPSEWVTWINGHKMRPSSLEGDGFRIHKVDDSSISISLAQHADKIFVLSPGESLNRSTGHIEDKVFDFLPNT